MHHARRATIALFAAALIVSACGTGDADHTASPATADAPISTTATATDTDTATITETNEHDRGLAYPSPHARRRVDSAPHPSHVA